jgi:hypothetical protein
MVCGKWFLELGFLALPCCSAGSWEGYEGLSRIGILRSCLQKTISNR